MTAQLKFLEPDDGGTVESTESRMVDVSRLTGKEKVEIILISVDLAQNWLDQYNVDNFRTMMPKTVGNYRKAIESGHFPLSNSMIILCTDPVTGKVILGDGQHRLKACVEAGIPIRQVVLTGADPAMIIHADRGKGRKFGDYLAWMKYGHANDLSMALKVFFTYKNNLDRISRPDATDDELLELVRNRPDINLAVQWATLYAKGRGKPIRMTASWLAVARALIFEVQGLPTCEDPDQARTDADFFFARLVDQDSSALVGVNNPIKQLIQVMHYHGSGSTERYPNFKMLALVIKAWNVYRSGKYISQLRVNLGGKSPETFPEPI